MRDNQILAAGIGNIFLGDDGFGCEVIRQWSQRGLPPGVTAIDFGIRGYDLAYALMEDYSGVILVDATPRGQTPGTVHVLELGLDELGPLTATGVDAHGLDPVQVLQMAKAMGAHPERLFLVGCEPADLGGEAGVLGLSEPVQAAVPKAVEALESLVAGLLFPGGVGVRPH